MQTSTMFLRNITCIDHAWIDKDGLIVGGSKHQEILVTGAVDEQEQVVVDFSNIKKFLKSSIDDKETGYDHKLWIFTEESNCTWSATKNKITITSPHFAAILPLNAVHIIEGSYKDLETDMSTYLLDLAVKQYGPGIVDITVNLTEEQFSKHTWRQKFTYTHGLKSSTSWGCQNPGHGHLSFVELVGKPGAQPEDLAKLADVIARYINGCVLVYKDNVGIESKNDFTINYDTADRGKFTVSYRKTHPHIFFDIETTVENIVSVVADKFKAQLVAAGVEKIFISEGLSKGACANV